MKASEGTFRSPLDKPLAELTDEDISQVTREDCRRYLKEKGMRRPSWNKSQVIQQVLSLKTLFESWPGKQETSSCKTEPAASGGPRRSDSALEGSPSGEEEKRSVYKGLEVPAVVPETSTRQPLQLPVFCPRGADLDGGRSAEDGGLREPSGDVPVPRTKENAGQMTIFYGGMVNVYDDVSTDKAGFVMLLAESPNFMPHVTDNHRPSAGPTRQAEASSHPVLPTSFGPPSSSFLTGPPKTRKESVQRFLEKRKERGRQKVSCGRPKWTSGLESYLTQQIRDSTRNLQSATDDTCSPTNPVPPSTPSRTGSFRSQPVFSGELNDDDVQDVAT